MDRKGDSLEAYHIQYILDNGDRWHEAFLPQQINRQAFEDVYYEFFETLDDWEKD